MNGLKQTEGSNVIKVTGWGKKPKITKVSDDVSRGINSSLVSTDLIWDPKLMAAYQTKESRKARQESRQKARAWAVLNSARYLKEKWGE